MTAHGYEYDDWEKLIVIYSKSGYVLNPFIDQDLSNLSFEDFESIESDYVKFEAKTIKRINKKQKATHHLYLNKTFLELTNAFSKKFKTKPNKYFLVKSEFHKLDQLFIYNNQSDIPDNEFYVLNLFGCRLTGHQIHEIRKALKVRFQCCSPTYDHIHPAQGPLDRFNANNIFVLTDAIGKFYYWLRDLYDLFLKNHSEICTAGNFNPENPVLQDYLNIIEAYYADNLFKTVQWAFEETYHYTHLNLSNSDLEEIHIEYIGKRLRKIRMLIHEDYIKCKASKRMEFITPIHSKLIQISSKAKKTMSAGNSKHDVKMSVRVKNKVYSLLKGLIADLEDIYKINGQNKVNQNLKILKEETNISQAVNSLLYNNWAKDGTAINSLFESMIAGGEINPDTHYEDFKNAFSNKKVKHKIGLCLPKSIAFYFFKQLKDEAKIEDNGLWIGASKSFFLSSHPDYDMKQLAFQKPTKNKSKIDRVNTLINCL